MPLSVNVAYFDSCAQAFLKGEGLRRDALHHGILPGMLWLQTGLRACIGWRSEVLRLADLFSVGAGIVLLARQVRTPHLDVPARTWTVAALLFVYLSSDMACHCEPDMWMFLPAVAALTLRCRQYRNGRASGEPSRRIFLRSLTEGLCWGAAFWLKPLVVASALACWLLFVGAVLRSRNRNLRLLGWDFAGVLLGGGAVLGLGFAEMVWSGAWPHFLPYLGAHGQHFQSPATLQDRFRTVLYWSPPFSFIHLVAIPLCVIEMLVLLRRNDIGKARSLDPWPGLLAGCYAGWMLQAHFFQFLLPYHLEPALLLGVALVAYRLWSLDRRRCILIRRSARLLAFKLLVKNRGRVVLGFALACALLYSIPGLVSSIRPVFRPLLCLPIVYYLVSLLQPPLRPDLAGRTALMMLLLLALGPFLPSALDKDVWMLLPALAALSLGAQRLQQLGSPVPGPAFRGAFMLVVEGACWAGAVAWTASVAVPAALCLLLSFAVATRISPGGAKRWARESAAVLACAFGIGCLTVVCRGFGSQARWALLNGVFLGGNPFLDHPTWLWQSDFSCRMLCQALLCLFHLAAVPLAVLSCYHALTSGPDQTSTPCPLWIAGAFYLGWSCQPPLVSEQLFFNLVLVLLAVGIVASYALSLPRRWSPLVLGVLLLPMTFHFLPPLHACVPKLFSPDYLAAWRQCWREGSSPAVRDRLTAGDPRKLTNWSALAEVKAYLLTQAVADGELTCLHVSTDSLWSELRVSPCSTCLMIEPALCLLPSARAQEMIDVVFSAKPKYIVCDSASDLRVLCPEEMVVFQCAPYFIIRPPQSGGKATWDKQPYTLVIVAEETGSGDEKR
jgi:hypothetical protein